MTDNIRITTANKKTLDKLGFVQKVKKQIEKQEKKLKDKLDLSKHSSDHTKYAKGKVFVASVSAKSTSRSVKDMDNLIRALEKAGLDPEDYITTKENNGRMTLKEEGPCLYDDEYIALFQQLSEDVDTILESIDEQVG